MCKANLLDEEYYPRVADAIVKRKLRQTGAVVIRGPKWCGKTMTALKHSNSALFMQDPDTLENNLALAKEKPSVLLRGDRPRLIDEWQEAPPLGCCSVYNRQRASHGGIHLDGFSNSKNSTKAFGSRAHEFR